MRIELLRAPDCPHADAIHREALAVLRELHLPVAIGQRVGAYPSPTLLVDGRDAITGGTPERASCCRLDRPSRVQILAAIRRAASAAEPGMGGLAQPACSPSAAGGRPCAGPHHRPSLH